MGGFKVGSQVAGGGPVRAADEGTGAVGVVVSAAGGGQCVPGGPRGVSGPRVPGGSGGACDPGHPSNPGGLSNPERTSIVGEVGAASGGALQMERAPYTPGPGGDAAPGARGPGSRLLQLYPIQGVPAGWTAGGWAGGGLARGGVGCGGRPGEVELKGEQEGAPGTWRVSARVWPVPTEDAEWGGPPDGTEAVGTMLSRVAWLYRVGGCGQPEGQPGVGKAGLTEEEA